MQLSYHSRLTPAQYYQASVTMLKSFDIRKQIKKWQYRSNPLYRHFFICSIYLTQTGDLSYGHATFLEHPQHLLIVHAMWMRNSESIPLPFGRDEIPPAPDEPLGAYQGQECALPARDIPDDPG